MGHLQLGYSNDTLACNEVSIQFLGRWAPKHVRVKPANMDIDIDPLAI